MFSLAMKVKDRRGRDMGIRRNSLSKALLVDHRKLAENNSKYTEAYSALDMWLAWIAAAVQVEDCATDVSADPKGGPIIFV